uniref:Uncharacterized protein n=1 Tax=Oryza brachyantha TaxID=4533 RepID=J3MDL5_ORYBR
MSIPTTVDRVTTISASIPAMTRFSEAVNRLGQLLTKAASGKNCREGGQKMDWRDVSGSTGLEGPGLKSICPELLGS